MKRVFLGLYALTSYTIGMASLLYPCGFMLNIGVAKGIDTGPYGPIAQSFLIDLAILAAFLTPHSIMARPAFKRWWTTVIPATLERATYMSHPGRSHRSSPLVLVHGTVAAW